MTHLLGIAAGGAIGATLRHALVLATGPTPGRGFPVGHFLVNALGSAAIGLVVMVLVARGLGESWRVFFVSGILGSFTTYSAFALDTVALLENGENAMAAAYVAATVAVCVGGCWLGLLAGRAILS